MLGKVLAISSLCAFVLLSALMQSTTPSSVHPVVILIVFILLYVLALGVLTFFVFIGAKLLHGLGKKSATIPGMTLKRAYLFASVLALAPVMFAGMASIGRTGFYEVALITTFEVVACFYVARQRSI